METVLTENERGAVARLAQQYGVSEQTVADIYLGVKNKTTIPNNPSLGGYRRFS